MNPDITRQRRNLIIASLSIIFLRFGEIKIKQISFLGAQVHIGNIEALYAGIWAIFIFLNLRYYQYFSKEENRGVKSNFNAKMNDLSYKKLLRDAANQFNIPYRKAHHYAGTFTFQDLKKAGNFTKIGKIEIPDYEQNRKSVYYYKVNVLRYTPEYLKSTRHIIFSRSELFDYYFPFALSAFTILYGLKGSWDGALLNVLAAFYKSI